MVLIQDRFLFPNEFLLKEFQQVIANRLWLSFLVHSSSHFSLAIIKLRQWREVTLKNVGEKLNQGLSSA